jgi:carbonic anhydrase/acetyltransferase-like protein (isoleucine patch superfamily)
MESYKGITPQLGEAVFVHPSSVLIGDIRIGKDSSIWPLVAARGDVNFIRIGERSNIQDGSVLHVTRPREGLPDGYPLIIGNDVTVGHKAMLHACNIGNQVLVGMSAVVMDGVVVEDDVIIGGGSVVTPGKRLRSGYLYVGSPAREVRPLSAAERSYLKASADNYVRLKNDYLNQSA